MKKITNKGDKKEKCSIYIRCMTFFLVKKKNICIFEAYFITQLSIII